MRRVLSGHKDAPRWPRPRRRVAARAEPCRTVGVAEINFKIPTIPRETRENQICTMGTMSESENYSLANPGEASSVAENGPKVLVDANSISATLHYSVGMTQDGNIRVKDSYCDSKEVSETYFQRPPHIFMMLLFSNRADEQILLDLIDFVMDGIMKAEAMAAKKCARLASKALLALKRSRSPPPKTKASADCGSPIQKKLKSVRKSNSAETQHSAVLWVNTNRPASKHRDWYPLLVAYWMSG